ncbi:MAG: M23 family metallopeptidase [Bacillaceae bacterium]|nr:M23 family metallopeptidase [Bacillaceae bacterium]
MRLSSHTGEAMTKKIWRRLSSKAGRVVNRLLFVIIRAAIKFVLKRLLWILSGSVGLPGLLSLILIIFIGGALIFFSVGFDWDMTGDGKEDPRIREQFIQASKESIDRSREEQLPYQLPWAVIAALERVRLLKQGGAIQPVQRMEELKPVFEYQSYPFENHRYTVITTCGPNGCKSYQTALKITHPRRRMLTKASTWEGVTTIHYIKKSEQTFHKTGERIYHNGEYTKTFTDYLKRAVYWEQEEKTFISDYSRLDTVFADHHFQPDDRVLFSEIARAFNPELNLPFITAYTGITPLIPGSTYTGTVNGMWGWPVPENTVITSQFGYRRITGRGEEFHKGIDIAPLKTGVNGDPVHAAADGRVTRAEWSRGGYGWVIYLRHEDGFQTRYAHLSRILVREEGQVKRGDMIGLMGNTGDSTNTHLHFEIRKNGRPHDPLIYIRP